jgi:hypothetical protein
MKISAAIVARTSVLRTVERSFRRGLTGRRCLSAPGRLQCRSPRNRHDRTARTVATSRLIGRLCSLGVVASSGAELTNLGVLVLGEDLGEHLVDAELSGDRVRDLVSVASDRLHGRGRVGDPSP